MSIKQDLVTQDNALINASYTLDLSEKRLILLSIAKSRKTGKGINAKDHLFITAKDYQQCFDVDSTTSYQVLKSATEDLFNRYFTYQRISEKGNPIFSKSRWVSDISYVEKEGMVGIIFAPAVVPLITELEKRFTSYFLDDISALTSIYAVRLYELIIAWKNAGKTPVFEIDDFRRKLGVLEGKYKKMSNFKQRVLDMAVNQINDSTNIEVRYEQHNKGRSITGFSFIFYEKEYDIFRDPDTVDWVEGSSDNEKEHKQKKRKTITKSEAERMARVGESWSELLSRLAPNFYIKDL